MSEENSTTTENGSEPLGRSSTIHLDMVDSSGVEANPAAATEASGDIVHAVVPEEDDLNIPINEPPVNGKTETNAGGDENQWAHLANAVVPAPEKYEFTESFPYFNKPDDIMYEESRNRLLQLEGLGTNMWLQDTDMHMILNMLLEEIRDKNAYVFSVNAWNAIRQEDVKGADQSRGIMIEHKAGMAYRYEEIVRKVIWLPSRGKRSYADRRQKQQKMLNLFQKDVLFLPINQDAHWSLIVINKPRLIMQKLLEGDFEKEEPEPPEYSEKLSAEGNEVADAVLPEMTSLESGEPEDGELEESENESEQVEKSEVISQKLIHQDGMLDSSSDEEVPESPREGETNDSGANESPEKTGDALDDDSPVSDEAAVAELSGLSLNEADGIANGQDEEEVNPERELPYDRTPEMSDEEEEDESSYDEEDDEEEQSETDEEKFERFHDEVGQREKEYLCPSEDEPGIYLLCSGYAPDWFEKVEVACEFLTSAFLDRDNEALREDQDRLIDEGILELDENAEDNRQRLRIVNGGRKPSIYFCNKTRLERSLSRYPHPCNRCYNMEPCLHKQLLPFKYGRPRGPHQANDFDCGPFTLFYIRRFFDKDRPLLDSHPDKLKKWFTLRDLFAFKYECRRYFDKLVGVPDREPVNQQGLAARYGYIDDFDEAVKLWAEEAKAAKQQGVNSPATNAPSDSEDTPAENGAPVDDSVDDGQNGDSTRENGVHEDAQADKSEMVKNQEEGEILDQKDEVKRDENAMEVDTNDTPPEVSPNYSEAQELPIPAPNIVAEKTGDKLEPAAEQQGAFDLEPASSELPTRRSSRRLSSTPQYVYNKRKPRPKTPGTPRRGSELDTSSLESTPLLGVDLKRSIRSPVKRKGSAEESMMNDRQAAIALYHSINQRATRTAKSKAVAVIPTKIDPRATTTPSRGNRRSRASTLTTPVPAERTVKRKIEKDSKDDAAKNKRRKTTSDVPDAPKSRRTPARRGPNRRKTMSSGAEPKPEPWTGETSGWTLIAEMSSSFYEFRVYGRYPPHRPGTPPAQNTPRRSTRKSVR